MESPLLSRNEDIELGSAYGNAAQGFSQLHSASQPRHSYHSSHQLRAVQTSFRERLHDFNHKWSASWLPEITSLVFAYAMFIVIIVVLRFSDSKRDISWPLGLSLNAFLALCSTLVRVAFMVPIAEGLGQLKWIWFGSRKPRPMDHFKAFDNASRGIWGSLVLLFSLKGILPSAGAIIAISGLFVSTITQQAIETRMRLSPIENGTASVSRLRQYSFIEGQNLAPGPESMMRVKSALLGGMYASSSEQIYQLPPSCSSGDCNWPEFGSLGVCAEVANLTAHGNETVLDELRKTSSDILGDLAWMTQKRLHSLGPYTHVPPSYSVVIDALFQPTGALKNSPHDLLLANMFIGYSDKLVDFTSGTPPDLSSLQFLELALTWCVKSFAVEVRGGVPSMTLKATKAVIVKQPKHSLYWSDERMKCYETATCYRTLGTDEVLLEAPIDGEEPYKINTWSAVISSLYLRISMYDAMFVDYLKGSITEMGTGVGPAFANALFGEFTNLTLPTPEEQLDRVERMVENMVWGLTDIGRLPSFGLKMDSPEDASVNGTVLVQQPFIHVRWSWISMLGAQLILSTAFLASVGHRTRLSGLHILKNSPIAALCGLDKTVEDEVANIEDIGELEHRAESLFVTIRRGGGGRFGRLLGLGFPLSRQA